MENTKNKVSFNKQKDCDRNKTKKMTWINIKTGVPFKKKLFKKHPKSCSICGKDYIGYIRNNRPNKYLS